MANTAHKLVHQAKAYLRINRNQRTTSMKEEVGKSSGQATIGTCDQETQIQTQAGGNFGWIRGQSMRDYTR